MASANSPHSDTSILIVGAGPVGLGLAIELGLRGVPCTVIEQRESPLKLPKASLLNTRTMEFCRRWGVVDNVLRDSLPEDCPYDIIFVTSVAGRELFRFRLPSFREQRRFSYSPERFAICSQIWFDPLLLERARAFPTVTIRQGTRFLSLVQDRDSVTARIVDTRSEREETIQSRYLIGCDGGESLVRKEAGIGMPSLPSINHNLNIFFRAPDARKDHPGRQGQLFRLIGPHGSWGNLNPLNGRGDLWRLTVHLKAPPDAETGDAARHVRAAMGPGIDFEIISAASWERREIVAERYRDGRVLLAGDAAHQLSTSGGFGMNTGLGDAADLGWMLAAEIAGWAGPDLLNAYEIERRPIAVRNVNESSGTFRRQEAMPGAAAIDEDSPAGDAARATFTDSLTKLDIRRQFNTEGVALGYRYDASPLVCPDGTPAPADESMTYTPTARPGSRAPHGWIAEKRSTLDLFGDGFTLLRFGGKEGDASALIDAGRSRNVPLKLVDIGDPAIAALYQSPFVLVRPDGHVAWRGARCDDQSTAIIDIVRGAGPLAAASKVA